MTLTDVSVVSFTIPSILNDSYRLLFIATSFKIICGQGDQSRFGLFARFSMLIGCESFSTVADFSIPPTKFTLFNHSSIGSSKKVAAHFTNAVYIKIFLANILLCCYKIHMTVIMHRCSDVPSNAPSNRTAE